MLPEWFQGLGLPNFVVLCLAEKIFFMQCHLDFEEAVGEMMLQAYEAFHIEVRLYGGVLTRDFTKFGSLATDLTWFKILWEYASHLKVAITQSDEFHLKLVREGDIFLMEAFVGVGFKGKELQCLGRMKNSKKVLHVSDLMKCDGVTIYKGLLGNLVGGESTHTHMFPLEKPTQADVRLWDDDITRICLPTFKLTRALGPYLCLGHRNQHWFRW